MTPACVVPYATLVPGSDDLLPSSACPAIVNKMIDLTPGDGVT